MAVTLGNLWDDMRADLRDTEQPYHVLDKELTRSVQSVLTLLAGDLPLGEKWDNAAVTLTSGSDTATLSASYEYLTIYALRRTSDGRLLTKRTPEELERKFWDEQTVTDKAHEDPTDYALTEDAGVVTVRFQAPVDDEATLDLRRAVLPSDLTVEASTVSLSTLARLAVSKMASAEMVGKLTKNELDQLRLDRGAAATFMAMGQKALSEEKSRKARLEGVGRPLRFVP